MLSKRKSNNKPEQIPFDLGHRSAHGLEDFLIGPENRDAVGWIDRWPDWPAPVLVINGPAASGKTHMAAVWRDKASASIVKPELLVERSADDIASMGDNLVIDGIDLWLGERDAEETLFHLYNMFKEGRRSFLVTSRIAPSHAEFAIPDLASRLRAAPVATIHPPDDTLLASILIKMFSDRQLNVNNDIVRYILPRMERSFAAARDIVAKADKKALAEKQKISIPLLRKVLFEMQSEEAMPLFDE
ncbi:MAG: DNA replication protein [Micavibrio sp.]|nr:DNA replication protein [Micavibrio sp.]|tara:strand:+ start:1735 stop:2469 length:735 start_codon:yes stop_codon:yes gene_type:complete